MSSHSGNNSAALASKTEGNNLLREGKIQEAIDKYTEAIELDPSVHQFFGNRSAALQKLAVQKRDNALYVRAVNDADEAIKLSSGWYKGHWHKANSLWRMGKMDEALNAAKAGAAACPGNKQLLELVSVFQEQSARTCVTNSVGQILWGNAKNKARLSSVPLWTLIFLSFVMYLNPFGSKTDVFAHYRRTLMLSMLDTLLVAFNTHGRPRMTGEYAMSLLKDPTVHRLMLCGVSFSGKPNIIGLLAIIGLSLVKFFSFVNELLLALLPPLGRLGKQFHRTCIVPIYNYPEWDKLTGEQREWLIQRKTTKAIAYAELILAVQVTLELFTSVRNVMTVFFVWQFLRMRYMMDNDTQAAFVSFGTVIRSVCPSFLLSYYNKLTSFLHNFASLPQQPPATSASSSSSFMDKITSKCSIM